MIGVGVIVTIFVARAVIGVWPIDPAIRTALRDHAVPMAADVTGKQATTAAVLARVMPGRFIRAAADGNLATVLLGAMLGGFLITFMPVRPRERVIHVFQRLHDGILRIVQLILLLTPFGVFSLTAGFAARVGVQAAGAMSYMLMLVGGLLLLYTIACYPLTALIGGVPMRRFARAVLPAQVFGLGTRSSVGALPLLLEGCERVLRLPPAVPRFVLPMMVSVFKVTRSVGSAKLLVLAHLYGVDIGPLQLLLFVLLETAAGSSPGLPQIGILTAPAYVASGIPLQGILLFSAVDTLIDTPKTLLNVTGAMTASTIVARMSALCGNVSRHADAGSGDGTRCARAVTRHLATVVHERHLRLLRPRR